MDDLAAAYVDSHMIDIAAAGVEQQISRLYGIHRDLPSLACLISGASPSADAKVGEHAHNEAGAVRAVCQAGAAVLIRIAQKLLGVCDHRVSGSGVHIA